MNQSKKTKSMILISMFTAVLVVLSYISIPLPLSPVNLTGQTFGIMLIGSVLGPLEACISVVVYLFLGAVGLPVFSGGHSGLGTLFGPTGGFLFSFILGVIIISFLKGDGKNIIRLAFANLIGGIIVVYLIGIPWLAIFLDLSYTKAAVIGALPFIPGDLIKVAVASISAATLNKRLEVINHNKEN